MKGPRARLKRRNNRRLVLTLALSALGFCGCAHVRQGPTGDGKVLLAISDTEIAHLSSKLGLTNAVCFSPGRDAKGERLLLMFWTHNSNEDRRCLVIVNGHGVSTRSWLAPNEKSPVQEEDIELQDPPHCGLGALWQPSLPDGYRVESVSDGWAAVSGGRPNRRLWLAKVNTPTVAAAELGNADAVVSIWASGNTVHVFTRPGWQYTEGPLNYRVYDVGEIPAKLVKEMTLPWAKFAEEMDPQDQLVVLHTNNRAWARTWLL